MNAIKFKIGIKCLSIKLPSDKIKAFITWVRVLQCNEPNTNDDDIYVAVEAFPFSILVNKHVFVEKIGVQPVLFVVQFC